MRQYTTDSNARHTHSDTSCKSQVQRKYSAVQREREREEERERGEKENVETTKTEKLCRVQSFNRIQQTAPRFFSLAVYV